MICERQKVSAVFRRAFAACRMFADPPFMVSDCQSMFGRLKSPVMRIVGSG